jgi:hypothetical protein
MGQLLFILVGNVPLLIKFFLFDATVKGRLWGYASLSVSSSLHLFLFQYLPPLPLRYSLLSCVNVVHYHIMKYSLMYSLKY